MKGVTRSDLRSLAADRAGPCVSLFLPITPGRPQENAVRLRSQIQRAVDLSADFTGPETADRLLAAARQLAGSKTLGTDSGHGLAHFAGLDGEHTFALRAEPPLRAVVGSVFYLRPLIAEVEPARFFLLTLSHRRAALYQGTADNLQLMEVPEMPKGIADALQTHDRDEPLTLHSFRRGGGAGAAEAIFHGHGVGIDDHKDDLVRYFRAVDHAVWNVLRDETAPLLLAGVRYLFPLYAQANSYPHLHAEGVPGNPDRSPRGDLHRAAWSLAAPLFTDRAAEAAELFRRLEGTDRAVTGVTDLIAAAREGGLASLFVTPGAEAWGRVGPEGRMDLRTAYAPGDDELYNVAAVHVLRHGGSVYQVDPAALGRHAGAGVRWFHQSGHP
jgi:hypothetical protein